MDYVTNNISIIRRTFDTISQNDNILSIRPFRNLFYPYITASPSKKYISLTLDILGNKGQDNERWGFIETSNPDANTEEISNGFLNQILGILKAPTLANIYMAMMEKDLKIICKNNLIKWPILFKRFIDDILAL